jgi:hypothetical protein
LKVQTDSEADEIQDDKECDGFARFRNQPTLVGTEEVEAGDNGKHQWNQQVQRSHADNALGVPAVLDHSRHIKAEARPKSMVPVIDAELDDKIAELPVEVSGCAEQAGGFGVFVGFAGYRFRGR